MRRRGGWLPVVVGATSLDDAAAKGREFIEWSDTAIEKTPLVNEALTIQQTIFDIADGLGIGSEVRAMVYVIRGAHYVGAAAANFGGSAAAAGLAASLGGFGALAAAGAIGAVVGLLAFVFGDDSDDYATKKKQAREKARASLLELLKPLSLDGFAAEQDKIVGGFEFVVNAGFQTPTQQQANAATAAQKATAAKLAQFFRAAKLALTPRQRQVFEGMLNVSRLGHAADLFDSKSAADKQRIGGILYKGEWICPGGNLNNCYPKDGWPDYGAMLRQKRDEAIAKLLQRRWQGPRTSPLLIAAAAGLAVVAVASPAASLGALKSVSSRLLSGARRLV